MRNARKISDADQVKEYLSKLDHPLSPVVQALRKIVLETNEEIGEQIKWNSLSFFYKGEMKPFDPKEYKRDILVLNLHKKEFVLLVFPTGATINDTSGFLEGDYADGRRLAKVFDLQDVNEKSEMLKSVVENWLKLVDK
jgi:hypothetical protein